MKAVLRLLVLAALPLFLPAPMLRAAQTDIQGPTGSGVFGYSVVVLPNGNIVVPDPYYSKGSTSNVGAVSLYAPTGALISTVTGSTANDGVGSGGITVLSNGNFVISSPGWNNGGATFAGALTWCSGNTGLSGTISASNSLVGSNANDQISLDPSSANIFVRALPNGNYVVCSPGWNNGIGAVTWGNGTTGTSGVVSSSNSLVGSTANDRAGNGIITILTNNNYVVVSTFWHNGTKEVGAVTWCNGATGLTGAISTSNSLTGSTDQDDVGFGGVTALSNGNYVVNSYNWINSGITAAGAVTWGSGTAGVTGVVSTGNSLTGQHASDMVGRNGVVALTNGNYVVITTNWQHSGVSNAGAVTWCAGTAATATPVSDTNSLVGTIAGDYVGEGGVNALPGGNYVVVSPYWTNGTTVNVGAVTWGSGTGGVSGVITSTNSLVGSTAHDQVGETGVTVLSNGNYVVTSPSWDSATNSDVGAATWASAAAGVHGVITSSNSLIGASDGDAIGQVTALTNGNYVVASSSWHNGAAYAAGSVTWGDGTTGVTGVVTASNSFVGPVAACYVGEVVTPLANGNYVVRSGNWNSGKQLVGAVTWLSGIAPASGIVSPANSLVGSASSDYIGSGGVAALPNGNYAVASPSWTRGATSAAGAVTWCDGTQTTSMVVSSANSLVGSQTGDMIGDGFVTALPDSRYVFVSESFTNGVSGYTDAGAVTLGYGGNGNIGHLSSINGVLGTKPQGGQNLVYAYDSTRGQLAVGRFDSNIVTLYQPTAEIEVATADDTNVNPNDQVSFGTTGVGSSSSLTLTIKNPGLGNLTGLSPTLADYQSGDFSITTNPTSPVAGPRGTTTVVVKFTPSATGLRYVHLSIPSNDTVNNPFVILLSGTGGTPALPQIVVSTRAGTIANGGTLAFGLQEVAAGTSLTLNISNTGTGPLNLSSETISGTNKADFTVDASHLTTPLAVNGQTSISITFNASATGSRSATLTLASDDPTNGSFAISLTGTGTQAQLAVSLPGPTAVANGGSYDFGTTALAAGTSVPFTLKNTGNESLSLTSVTITGTNAGDFVKDVDLSGTSINAGGQASFNVTFQPSATGSRSASLVITSSDPNNGTYTIALSGTGNEAPGSIGFSTPVYTVNQGSVTATLTVNRTGGTLPTTVTIATSNGTASTVPPFSVAVATGVTGDYVALTSPNTTLSFGQGDTSKTVSITLIPKVGTLIPNKRFNVALSSPTANATLGTSTATVEILANDVTKPTLTVTSPTTRGISAVSPITVTGVAGDARGIDRVTVALNGGSAVNAVLGHATLNTAVPYALPITPLAGSNTIVVTAYDLKGNNTSVTVKFTYTQRFLLTVARSIPAALGTRYDTAGTVAMTAAITAATALTPITANTDPKTSQIVPTTSVRLTATARAGYVFSYWTGVPSIHLTTGNVVTFPMPSADTTVTAVFVATPFGTAASNTGFYGLIHPTGSTVSSNATEGFLHGTLTTAGVFTGTLQINGLAQPIAATFYGDNSCLFTVGSSRLPSLTFSGITLTMSYSQNIYGDQIIVTVSKGTDTSAGIAYRGLYSAANKVAASTHFYSTATTGYFTLLLQHEEQVPAMVHTTYPQGDGYATLTMTSTGGITFTITLADGTTATGSSALVAGNVCPFFVQLVTPGAAATVKGGSYGGTLTFFSQAASDITSTDLLWFRPTVTASTRVPATQLYSAGWPGGIKTNGVGALYYPVETVQSALGLATAPVTTSNARLTFGDGKLLISPYTQSSFNITKDVVTKIPKTNPDFTLVLGYTVGTFSGTFKPNWASPSATKPAFKGIIVEKPGMTLTGGYFISNALSDTHPESGSVLLAAPLPIVTDSASH